EVPHPTQEPIDHARCAPPPAGQYGHGLWVDVHAEDAGRPGDDGRELVLRVIVQPIDRPEPIPERAADASGARRRADDRERLESEAQAARRWTAADHHVDREILHRGVEELLDRVVEAVDLVYEKDIALFEVRQDRGKIAGPLHG